MNFEIQNFAQSLQENQNLVNAHHITSHETAMNQKSKEALFDQKINSLNELIDQNREQLSKQAQEQYELYSASLGETASKIQDQN